MRPLSLSTALACPLQFMMENQQQPCKKRTRSHSASSSASQNNSNQPTKTIRTSQNQNAQSPGPEVIPSPSPQTSQAPDLNEIALPELKPSDHNNSSKTSEDGSKLLQDNTLATDSPNPETALSTAETGPVSETTPVVYSNGDWAAVYDPQYVQFEAVYRVWIDMIDTHLVLGSNPGRTRTTSRILRRARQRGKIP